MLCQQAVARTHQSRDKIVIKGGGGIGDEAVGILLAVLCSQSALLGFL